ncbi:MAG: Gfo/Idh/MocA family oxidoreductase [Proteobacteria bacterium]|nr:Gfo/Idh/MocA family oxidoreductase [Pseudomonadota bacterium]
MKSPTAGKRAVVAGYGAIGRRYAHWMKQLGCNVAVSEPDSKKRTAASRDEAVSASFASSEEAVAWQPDYAIVATPPHVHAQASLPFVAAGTNLLIEKPLADTLDAGRQIFDATDNRRNIHVVCNMRFHLAVRAIRENLHRIGRPLYYKCLFGHRLSQMRTSGGDFAKLRGTGGGVVLDCIHELDYLNWMFGEPLQVESVVNNFGLDQNSSEDLAQIWMRHEGPVFGFLHFDFLRRQKIRGLEVTGEDASLVWLSEGKAPELCRVTISDRTSSHILLESDNLDGNEEYLGMLRAFLIDGTGLQTLDEAMTTLGVALRARDGTIQ